MVDVLLGLQFGDCGKGKIIDCLASKYNAVARFSGGDNCGHTIFYKEKKYVLHLIPSGIFYGKKCMIGNGVVINPVSLKNEIELLEKDGIKVKDNLYISKNAQLITPEHIQKDIENEKILNIGTTKKGIGPAYTSKVERTGIRVGDIKKILDRYKVTNPEYNGALEYLLKLRITNLESMLNGSSHILAEGAQGTLLDVDFGTYPYVSSSNSTIGGVITGLGVSPKQIDKVYGVFKVYMTRVGNGPFVTELKDEVGEKIREIGKEYGATTGRPRRCGWLDIPALRYACMINGVTDLVMTKTDVLNDFDEINVCVYYDYLHTFMKVDGGESTESMLSYKYDNYTYVEGTKPVYKTFKGWNTISNKEPLEKLIRYIENEVGVKVTIVSTGKERDDFYYRNLLNYV